MNKQIAVYSQRIAGKLMTMGFVLQFIEKNPRYPSKNMFIFSNSEEIQEALNKLTNK